MTHSAELRLPDDLLRRLQEEADARHSSAAELAEEMLDEALKMRRFPGIEYRDGTTGRRAALSRGPDVWEIISAFRFVDGDAESQVATLAAETGVAAELIRLAVEFYETYSDEVDADIAANDEAVRQLRKAMERREPSFRA